MWGDYYNFVYYFLHNALQLYSSTATLLIFKDSC